MKTKFKNITKDYELDKLFTGKNFGSVFFTGCIVLLFITLFFCGGMIFLFKMMPGLSALLLPL